MDAKEAYEQRLELIEIFNELSIPLKKQLLAFARMVDATREIVLSEGKKNRVEKEKPL